MTERSSDGLPPDLSKQKATDLAFERTRFAADRTLMAWIRTSISMIGFGFTIFKFFQYLRESSLLTGYWRPRGPRNLGLTLIALGTSFLVLAIAQYFLFLRRLSREADHRFPISTPLVAAVLLTALGLLALVDLLLRIGLF
jgi:putative membrane protein